MIVMVLGKAMNAHMETHAMSTAAMIKVTTCGSHKTNLESPTTVRTAVKTSTTQLNSGINLRGTFSDKTTMMCV